MYAHLVLLSFPSFGFFLFLPFPLLFLSFPFFVLPLDTLNTPWESSGSTGPTLPQAITPLLTVQFIITRSQFKNIYLQTLALKQWIFNSTTQVQVYFHRIKITPNFTLFKIQINLNLAPRYIYILACDISENYPVTQWLVWHHHV